MKTPAKKSSKRKKAAKQQGRAFGHYRVCDARGHWWTGSALSPSPDDAARYEDERDPDRQAADAAAEARRVTGRDCHVYFFPPPLRGVRRAG